MKTITPRLASQADVFRCLGRQIAEDCMGAGWLKPRVSRQGTRKTLRIFAVEDVRRCEDRILNGEYPFPRTQKEA
jgi:hypothetical protein